jgi:phosphonopyruvate decarboxylase
MTQKEFLSKLLKRSEGKIIITSLGTISKDICELDWGYNLVFPVKGAMGCVMGIGLGMALNTELDVVVIIGDGSFLMKMGSISTIMKYKLKNLKVIILNNGCYASCGGQKINDEILSEISLPKSHFRIVPVY